jgi:hypothetical protein
MKIENAQYGKNSETNENSSVNCIIDGSKWSVPLDPNNRHYAEILKQVEEGTLTIKDAE